MMTLCSMHPDIILAPVVLGIPMNYSGRIWNNLDFLYYLSVLKESRTTGGRTTCPCMAEDENLSLKIVVFNYS